ncbi:MAG: recombinase family protein [Solirubrobacterales bacterium]|nr:recombinase family protein [Solirubrobacterales bacterium]
MNAQPLRLDAIIRVSSLGQRTLKDLRSPDQQREVIERQARGLGAEVHFHGPEINLSGKTVLDRRDVQRVLERIRAGQTDGLIVAYLSRLTRAGVDEALATKAAVEEAGGRLRVCDLGGMDLDTAAGEMAFTMLAAVTRFQWREIKERFDQSRRNAIKAGKSMREPFGYRYADPTKRPSGRGVIDSRLVAVEELRPVVRGLFERKADGWSWTRLARWLDEVAPRESGLRWNRQTVIGITRSRTYLGDAHHGDFSQPEAHEALVSPSLWRRAQNEPGQRTPRGNYLLTGLVRCAGCGRTMRGANGRPGADRVLRIYKCVGDDCTARSSVSCELLEAEVARFLSDVEVETPDAPSEGEADLTAARELVERLGAEVERLAVVAPTHPRAVAVHAEALASKEQELVAAERDLDQIEARRAGGTSWDRVLEVWREFEAADDTERERLAAEADEAAWAEANEPGPDLAELRDHLRGAVDAVLIRRTNSRDVSKRALVLVRGEAPEVLRPGGRAPVTTWQWDDDASTLRRAT